MHHIHTHKITAFTLLETLIILVIISIILALSLPTLSGLISRNNNETLAIELLNAIRFAQQEAINKREKVGLCFSDEHDRCIHASTQLLVFSVQQKKLAMIKLNVHQGVIHWRSYPQYRDFLQFSIQGGMNNDNATFWYCQYGNRKPVWAITLDKMGNVRVRDNPDSSLSCNHYLPNQISFMHLIQDV